MPMYSYRCNNPECKHEDEKLESMSAPEVQKCPKCNSENTFIRIIKFCSAFVLSGGGWCNQGYSK